MNYFTKNFYTVLGFLFGLYMIYSGIDGLITGEIYIGGRGTSSGTTFTRPESTYASLSFILIGCLSTYWFVMGILNHRKK